MTTVPPLLAKVPPVLSQLPPMLSVPDGAVKDPPDIMFTVPAIEKGVTEHVTALWKTQVSVAVLKLWGLIPVLLFTDHHLLRSEASPPSVDENQVVPLFTVTVKVAVAVPQLLVWA